MDSELALSYMKKRRYVEAEKVLLKAVENNPKDLYLRSLLADVYEKQDRLQEARALAEEVLAVNPKYPEALKVIGNICLQEENYEEALRYFEMSFSIQKSSYVQSRIGEAYLGMKKPDLALDIAEKGLSSQPEDLWFLRLKARALEQKGKLGEAAAVYKVISKKDPENRFGYARYLLLSSSDKDPESAVKDINRIMRIPSHRDNPELLYDKAMLLKRGGRLKEAIEELKKALELSPGDSFYMAHLGYCYKDLGEYDQAIAILEEVVRANPKNPYALRSLEGLYKKACRVEDGIKFFEGLAGESQANKHLWGIARRISKGRKESRKKR